MRRLFSSTTAFVAGLVLVAVVGALLILPSNDYIFLPDEAHPVAPLVNVEGGHDPTVGGIYYVDILLRKAKLYEQLLGGYHEGADDRNQHEAGDERRRAREEAPHRRPRDMPPSTRTVVPLTYEARADARKHTTSPNSRGVPSRPSGICVTSSAGGPPSP